MDKEKKKPARVSGKKYVLALIVIGFFLSSVKNLTFLLPFRTMGRAHWPPGTLSIFVDLNFTN